MYISLNAKQRSAIIHCIKRFRQNLSNEDYLYFCKCETTMNVDHHNPEVEDTIEISDRDLDSVIDNLI